LAFVFFRCEMLLLSNGAAVAFRSFTMLVLRDIDLVARRHGCRHSIPDRKQPVIDRAI
jgi:hypothetical protein